MSWRTVLLGLAGAALIALPVVVPMTMDLQGSDDQGAAAIEATGHKPWANPLWEPGDSLEPLIFAAQAAIGVGGFAWVLWRRRSRAHAAH